MKIKYFSDLHSEKGNKTLAQKLVQDNTVDVIVFAGDFINLEQCGEKLEELDAVANCPIVFLPGNHDYYGSRRPTIDDDLASREYKHVIILNEASRIIENVCFVGATCWWDTPVSRGAFNGMNDFVMIAGISTEARQGEWGQRAKQFFEDSLQRQKRIKTVCISHHAPSYRSIPDDLLHRDINQCYANNWEHLIEKYQPDLWIHGHIHQQSNDYKIGRTRVVSNPYGYARSQKINPDWREDCTVSI